jgi:hypothetical protein
VPTARVPPALIQPCPTVARGGIVKTRDLVNRLTATRAALDVCSAQVRGVAAWDQANAAADAAK